MEREFTISGGMKFFYGMLALGMFVFSIYLFDIYKPSVAGLVLILPFLMWAGSILIIINIIKRKVIVYEDKILCINLFSRKELAITAIKGCRIGQKAIFIEPLLENNGKITIGNYSDLRNCDELVKWIKDNFKDLDSSDLENEHNTVLKDIKLGATEKDRESNLKKAKKVALIYNMTGTVISFIVIAFDGKLGVLLLLIYPLFGILVIGFSKGLIKFVSNPKRSVYAFVTLGISIPGFVMLFKSVDLYNIFQSDHVWLPALMICGVVFVTLKHVGINRSIASVKGQAIVMFVVALMYGFGAVFQINCVFDNSKLEIYTATIFAHRVSHGRHTSYYLTLSPWGPREEPKEVDIHRHLYESTSIGDSVKVNFRKGLLDIPWFIVTKN